MADMIQFKYGLQSAYEGVEPKGTSTMYLITDTHRVYLGETLLADHNVDFVTQAPSAEEAKDGVLYVVTTEEGTSIVTKGQDGQVITVGGGEASKYKEGSITFEALSSDSVATEISPDAASDSKLATESAVQKYVDGVKESLTESIKSTLTDKIVVGVETGDPSSEDPNKIGLHFSTKKKNADGTAYEDGDEIVIDLDKEKFLSSATYEASYDPSSHEQANPELSGKPVIIFTVTGSEAPLVVDVSSLVDTYESGSQEGDVITVTVAEGKISAKLNITSSADGSLVTTDAEGKLVAKTVEDAVGSAITDAINAALGSGALKDALDKKMNTLEEGNEDEVILSGADGAVKRSGKKLGDTTLSESGDDLVAMESAVIAALTLGTIE